MSGDAAGPPSGTVTFLFTDLEGSTRLWEDHPEEMKAALARHDDLMREAVESCGGHVVKMILRGAFWQIGIGLGLGIPLAILAGKLMKDQLFGVQPWDPRMLAGAAVLLALAALVASVAPVRRAAGVEPMVALRTD